jgi:hypothetical protein
MSEGGSMIARRVRHHAGGTLAFREILHRIGGAPELEGPVFWKFSHLKKSFAPLMASSCLEVRPVLRCTYGLISLKAAQYLQIRNE